MVTNTAWLQVVNYDYDYMLTSSSAVATVWRFGVLHVKMLHYGYGYDCNSELGINCSIEEA